MRFLINIFKSKQPRIYWFLYWNLVQLNLFKRFLFCPEILLSSIIKKGDNVIDIGANTGQLTLLMAILAGKGGSVHAFEPYSKSFDKLSNIVKNAKLSSIIKLNKLALSNETRSATLRVPLEKCTEATLIPHKSDAWLNYESEPWRYATETCHLITLDNYVKENAIKNISFIKCDVEGAELPVFMGGENLLKGPNPPILMIEAYEEWTKSFGYHPRDLFSFLEKTAGYEFYWLHEGGLKKIKSDYSSLPGIYWRWLDYLCIVPDVHNISPDIVRFLTGIKKCGFYSAKRHSVI
ncbi:MAG: FkbM family methyltransferase [Acetobacterium woodii]|nr:FkbM family methyltransferase [Acetobacterium woodii]